MMFFFFFKQKTAYEIMPSLVGSEMCIRDRYQRRVHGLSRGLSCNEENRNLYKQFSPYFFDIIVIHECRRGDANKDSIRRKMLSCFNEGPHPKLSVIPNKTNDQQFRDPICACYSIHRIDTFCLEK
eukprot:TRINITY_DN11650_c0_g1_i1.p2 TRINITY_DN11650_c0_g1~~TRINITY_DN11650_c0_g1_i1.p2  ORF type:complete len:126 (-),score=7.97 TRINITY_DN11650_c0_g1_i1:231-608(-)